MPDKQKIELRYSFKETLKLRFYNWLIDVIKKLVLICLGLVIIYAFMVWGLDYMLSDTILGMLGISQASWVYNVVSPYLRFSFLLSAVEAVKRIIPLRFSWRRRS